MLERSWDRLEGCATLIMQQLAMPSDVVVGMLGAKVCLVVHSTGQIAGDIELLAQHDDKSWRGALQQWGKGVPAPICCVYCGQQQSVKTGPDCFEKASTPLAK
jgi:hypothetical protein